MKIEGRDIVLIHNKVIECLKIMRVSLDRMHRNLSSLSKIKYNHHQSQMK